MATKKPAAKTAAKKTAPAAPALPPGLGQESPGNIVKVLEKHLEGMKAGDDATALGLAVDTMKKRLRAADNSEATLTALQSIAKSLETMADTAAALRECINADGGYLFIKAAG